jgi:hypothetical protein
MRVTILRQNLDESETKKRRYFFHSMAAATKDSLQVCFTIDIVLSQARSSFAALCLANHSWTKHSGNCLPAQSGNLANKHTDY